MLILAVLIDSDIEKQNELAGRQSKELPKRFMPRKIYIHDEKSRKKFCTFLKDFEKLQ